MYVKVHKGMYGLLKAGFIVQQLLAKRLVTHGYTQSKFTPGLKQFLDYAATNPDALMMYHAIDMVLAVHEDV